jgi:hypothetical protein
MSCLRLRWATICPNELKERRWTPKDWRETGFGASNGTASPFFGIKVYSLKFRVYSLLFIVYCLLFIVYCLLFIVYGLAPQRLQTAVPAGSWATALRQLYHIADSWKGVSGGPPPGGGAAHPWAGGP